MCLNVKIDDLNNRISKYKKLCDAINDVKEFQRIFNVNTLDELKHRLESLLEDMSEELTELENEMLRCEHEFEPIEDDYFVCTKCGMENILY